MLLLTCLSTLFVIVVEDLDISNTISIPELLVLLLSVLFVRLTLVRTITIREIALRSVHVFFLMLHVLPRRSRLAKVVSLLLLVANLLLLLLLLLPSLITMVLLLPSQLPTILMDLPKDVIAAMATLNRFVKAGGDLERRVSSEEENSSSR